MKTPKHSVGEVVIVCDNFDSEKSALLIEEVIIKKKEVRYVGHDAGGNGINAYDREEFDYSDGREPCYAIIASVGMYNEKEN